MHFATHISIYSTEFTALAAELRAGKVILPPVLVEPETEFGPNLTSVLHSQASLEALGFVYSRDLIAHLSWLELYQIALVHNNVRNMLSRALGAHRVYEPMYPDFPEQVLSASDGELLANAFMHYLGDWLGFRILPKYVASARPALREKVLGTLKPKVLDVASRGELTQRLGHLVRSNASLSTDNKALLLALLTYAWDTARGQVAAMISPENIPQKEIRALVGSHFAVESPALFQPGSGINLAACFTTATDVLRLASALNQPNLAEADLTLTSPRFAKMRRPQRKMLLALLEPLGAEAKRNAVLGEMFQRRSQWLRLGETIHPGEYARAYPQAARLFDDLRNNRKPVRWAGVVEETLAHGNSTHLAALLSQRPGVFARKLHEVLRKAVAADRESLADAFLQVADKVATPVLLQLRHRLLTDMPTSGVTVKSFAPKAGCARIWVQQPAVAAQKGSLSYKLKSALGAAFPVPETKLNENLVRKLAGGIEAVLISRFAKLPALGAVYVAPELRGVTIPFGQRTAQKSLLTVGRGSRLPLSDGNILRAFLWWNENGLDKHGNPIALGRTDLDLSCAVLSRDFAVVDHCSFTRLRTPGLTHSGDITSAPNGACEFLDIDFSKLPKDAAYVALLAYAYTRQDFAEMPEAYLGWMTRADGQSGQIYDPRTVQMKIDLTAAGQRVLIGYLDVAKREFIWGDVVLPARCGGFNAIESSTDMLSMMAPALTQSLRPTLYDLLDLHIRARGIDVQDPADADLVVTAHVPRSGEFKAPVLTVFDAERICADFLA